MVADLIVKTADVRAVLKVAEIAKMLGITRDAVYKWPGNVPANQAAALIRVKPTIAHNYVEREIKN